MRQHGQQLGMQEIIMLGTITHSSSIYKDVWNVLEMSDMWRAKYHTVTWRTMWIYTRHLLPPKKNPKNKNKKTHLILNCLRRFRKIIKGWSKARMWLLQILFSPITRWDLIIILTQDSQINLTKSGSAVARDKNELKLVYVNKEASPVPITTQNWVYLCLVVKTSAQMHLQPKFQKSWDAV